MKKLLLSLLSFLLILNSIAALSAFADDPEVLESQDGSYSYSLNDTGITIVKFHDRDVSGTYEIPSAIDGHTVTEIGTNAFPTCHFTDVIIPETITKLSFGSFAYNETLHSVTIPSSVTQIDGNPFSNCLALAQIAVSSDNKAFTVNQGVLFNTLEKSLICYPTGKECTVYSVPAGTTTIGEYAFLLSRPEEIILPDTITSIGKFAFMASYNLKSVYFPSSVTEIGNGNPFAECIQFTDLQFEGNDSITFKDNLLIDTLHNRVIACITPPFHRVDVIVVPSEIEDLAPYAFNNCDTGTIILLSTVKSISDYAFFRCSAKDIILPDSLEQIGNNSFTQCSNLTELVIPRTVTSIDVTAFVGDYNLTFFLYPGSPMEDFFKEYEVPYELVQEEEEDTSWLLN